MSNQRRPAENGNESDTVGQADSAVLGKVVEGSLLESLMSDNVDLGCEDQILARVEANSSLLEQLLGQVSELRGAVQRDTEQQESPDQSDLEEECETLRDRIFELESQLDEMQQQNGDLASQVATETVRQTVSSGGSSCSESLSWEDRKQLIMQQMEEDSFDADAFASSLESESAEITSVVGDENAFDSPVQLVHQLVDQLQQRQDDLQRKEEEIGELRFLLDQQSETREGGIAVGAAAIAELVDADELVQQERERLQTLQEEWEEKFRQGEIEASLERAKLSRERQELAKKQAELEDQLDRIRRENRQNQDLGGKTSRRWMAKLGLVDEL